MVANINVNHSGGTGFFTFEHARAVADLDVGNGVRCDLASTRGDDCKVLQFADAVVSITRITIHKYLPCAHQPAHQIVPKTAAQATLFVLEKEAQII